MAGICSAHKEKKEGCELCNIDISNALPDYERKLKEAQLAGLHKCIKCEFEYYKTTNLCPLCGKVRTDEENQ